MHYIHKYQCQQDVQHHFVVVYLKIICDKAPLEAAKVLAIREKDHRTSFHARFEIWRQNTKNLCIRNKHRAPLPNSIQTHNPLTNHPHPHHQRPIPNVPSLPPKSSHPPNPNFPPIRIPQTRLSLQTDPCHHRCFTYRLRR